MEQDDKDPFDPSNFTIVGQAEDAPQSEADPFDPSNFRVVDSVEQPVDSVEQPAPDPAQQPFGQYEKDALYGRGEGDRMYREATGQPGQVADPMNRPMGVNPEGGISENPAREVAQTALGEGEAWDMSTRDMYTGLTPEEATLKYETILSDPNTEAGPLTRMLPEMMAIYTNPVTGERNMVMPPSLDYINPREMLKPGSLGERVGRTFEARPVVGVPDLIRGGLLESAGAVLELGAAGVDTVTNNTPLPDTNLVDTVQSGIANVDTDDSLLDSLVADGVPALLAGFGVGAKAAGAIGKQTGFLPNLARGIGIVASGEAAATATVSTDEGTVVLGPGKLFKGIDLGSDEADAIIEQRLNTFTEGMLLSSAFAGLGVGSKGASELLWQYMLSPIYNAARSGDSGIEKRVYESIVDAITGLPADASPQQIAEARQRVADLANQYSDILVPRLADLKAEPREVTVDTITAYLRGLEDIPGGMTPGDRQSASTASGLRAGHIQSTAGTRTQEAMAGPVRAFEDELRLQRESLGGPTVQDQTNTILQASDEIVGSGVNRIGMADDALNEVTNLREAAENRIVDAFDNDLQFGATLDRLGEVTGTDIGIPQGDRKEQILDYVQSSYETLKQRKNDAYSRVQGGAVDIEGLVGQLDNLPRSIFSMADENLAQSSPLRKLLAATRVQSRSVDGEMIEETQEERIERITGLFASEGYDYGKLYRELRPELSYAAQQLFQDGGSGRIAGNNLRQFINYIDDDMLGYVEEVGDAATAEAARAAKAEYAENYAQVFGQGVMRDYAEIYDGTINRGVGREQGYRESAEPLLTGVLSGSNPPTVIALRDAIEAGGNDSGAVAQYMVADVLDGFSRQMRTEGLAGVNAEDISSRLQPYAEALRRAYPDQAEALTKYIGDIATAQKEGRELAPIIEAAAQQAQATREQVRSSVVGAFLDRTRVGDDLVSSGDPYNSFASIFRSKGGIDRIDELNRLIDNEPEATQKIIRDGMAVAYSRYLDDVLLPRGKESGGGRPVSVSAIDKSEDDVKGILNIGDKIHADKPEVMEAIRGLTNAVGLIAKEKSVTPVKGMSPTAFLQDAQTATNRLIYTVVGPLSRPGTRMRAAIGALMDSADATGRARTIKDNIFANPDEFMRLSRLYNREPTDTRTEELLLRMITSAGMKSGATDETDAQMEGAFDLR